MSSWSDISSGFRKRLLRGKSSGIQKTSSEKTRRRYLRRYQEYLLHGTSSGIQKTSSEKTRRRYLGRYQECTTYEDTCNQCFWLERLSTWIQKMFTQKICRRYTEDVFDIIRMLSCLIRCSVVIYNIEYPANLIKRFIYNYTDLCNQCFWLERQST